VRRIDVKPIRLVLLLTLLAIPLQATTIVLPTDDQLIDKTPLIAVATVNRTGVVERNGGLWTEVELQLEEVLKGVAPSPVVVVREVGGELDGRRTVIFGAPAYEMGERVLVFLTPTRRGDYQTIDLYLGRFVERRTVDGLLTWYRQEESEGVRLLTGRFSAAAPASTQRSAERFTRYIAERVAGRQAAADYLLPEARYRSIEPHFTLIAEPTIYRWFTFASGGTASWRSVGTQPGYTNGGVNELQSAMNAWTGYSQALIRYSYSGVHGGVPGGLNRPNGVNEILFNDPLGEIAGSYSGSSGGVVGVGGFNAVAAAGSWTGPFDADPVHRAQTYPSTWNIVEGNLVIQDGVSPSNGISSLLLAEILSHELGHTLGFGHSADSSALMYFRLNGLGPSLRSDDQLGARWLYPASGGGSTQTIPAAPSALAAQLSGSNGVQLTWKDNATNETSQRVYIAVGNGGLTRHGDVGANQTSYIAQNLVRGQTYRFQVTALNSAGESAPSNMVQIAIPGDTVQAAFNRTPFSGIAGQTTFSFVDQSTGPVVSRSWNFGDGSSSTATNPTHLYAAPGTFNVTLTVWGSNGGTSSATRAVVVTLPDAPLHAAMQYSPSSPTVIDTVHFFDASSGLVGSWEWDFGDGTGSDAQNPTKRFVQPGRYDVKLTVRGPTGSATHVEAIHVGSGSGGGNLVEADFDWSVASPAPGETISFNDRSTGSPTSWYWDFGDGFASFSQNPTHRYQEAGTYTVRLNSGNLTSNSSRLRELTVRVPQPSFRAILPVAAQTSGMGGSRWRTGLAIFNGGAESAAVELRYLPQEGREAASTTLLVEPRHTAVVDDALMDLFGVSDAAGAIAIEATGTDDAPLLSIGSRTFTNGASGSYGQYVPVAAGAESPATSWLTGLRIGSDYRTNVGLVNASSEPVTALLELKGSDGTILGSVPVTLPPGSFRQQALTALFAAQGIGSLTSGTLKVTASTTNGLFAYASIIDNESQDPIYLPATAAPAGRRLILPAIARAEGSSGTFWRTDLTLHNHRAGEMALELQLVPGAFVPAAGPARQLILQPGETLTIADVVDWFGSSAGVGGLTVDWSGSEGPVVASRTYTDAVDGGGTFGQGVRGVATLAATRQTIPGLRSDALFRTNIGLGNASSEPAELTLRLFRPDGSESEQRPVIALQPLEQLQHGAAQLFAELAAAPLTGYSIIIDSTVAGLYAYGSVVDNASGDPIFITGE
jgi:PKD repeat protein